MFLVLPGAAAVTAAALILFRIASLSMLFEKIAFACFFDFNLV